MSQLVKCLFPGCDVMFEKISPNQIYHSTKEQDIIKQQGSKKYARKKSSKRKKYYKEFGRI